VPRSSERENQAAARALVRSGLLDRRVDNLERYVAGVGLAAVMLRTGSGRPHVPLDEVPGLLADARRYIKARRYVAAAEAYKAAQSLAFAAEPELYQAWEHARGIAFIKNEITRQSDEATRRVARARMGGRAGTEEAAERVEPYIQRFIALRDKQKAKWSVGSTIRKVTAEMDRERTYERRRRKDAVAMAERLLRALERGDSAEAAVLRAEVAKLELELARLDDEPFKHLDQKTIRRHLAARGIT
jgi:hypothetical protein